MSSRLISVRHHINPGVIGVSQTQAPNQLLIGPVDIGHYQSFSILYQNSATNSAFLDLQVEAAADPNPGVSGSDVAPNWVQIPTATLPQPSALGATASVLTGPVNPNCYRWIRVVGRVTVSSTQNILAITITGHKAE